MKRAKILITLVTIICMAVTMFPAYTFAEEATAENVIEIGTATQLQDEAKKAYDNSVPTGTTYKLTADIDFSGFSYEWSTIAVPFGTEEKPFCGTFDGNGHVIKNLTVGHNSIYSGAGGLFGALGDGAVVKNLGMENTTVNNNDDYRGIAVVAGSVSGNVTITDCYIRDTVYVKADGQKWIGGFVFQVLNGATLNITNCYVTGTKSAINNCMLRGEMFAWSDNNTETITLTNCYTDTNQLAPKPSTTSTTVVNCYANSEGLYNWWNAYNTGEWLGTAVTASELKSKAAELGSAFENEPLGTINNGYPILSWELGDKFKPGDATIVQSTPENNSADVNVFNLVLKAEFDRYLKTETVKKENIIITPAVDFEVEEISDEMTDTVTIKIDNPSLATQYTVSFSDAIKTIAGGCVESMQQIVFTTISEYPTFEVVYTDPSDNATAVAVSGTAINVEYSMDIADEYVNERYVSVLPSASFTVKRGDAKNNLVIEFSEDLKPSTEYTVTLSSDICSVVNTYAVEKIIKFTTEKGFENLIPGGDFENSSSINNFTDSNNGANLSLLKENELKGEVNTVLCLSPAWGDQPVLYNCDLDSGRSYYMSAWIKSDATQDVSFTWYKKGDRWDAKKITLEAGVWTFVGFDFNLGADEKTVYVSIRAANGKTINIDDWSLYDTGYALKDEPAIVETNIENGAQNVSPVLLTANIKFNVPIKLGTLLNDIKTEPAGIIEKVIVDAEDLYRCTIVFKRLETDKQYTLDFSQAKSMAGKSVADSITFTTIASAQGDTAVATTVPVNGAQSVKKNDVEIKITFTSAVDPQTVSGITVTPDVSATPEVKINDLYNCVVTIDKTKLKKNTTYTVSVPDTVKTLNGYKAIPYSFTFTTVTDAELLQTANAALSDASAMESAVDTVCAELDEAMLIYEYMTDNIPEKKAEFYVAMASENTFGDIDEFCTAIKENAFKIILNNVSSTEEISKVIGLGNGILSDGLNRIFNDILGDSSKNSIAADIKAIRDKEYDEICEIAATKIICAAFRSKSGPDAVKEILELSKESFSGENDISDLITKINNNNNSEIIYGELQRLNAGTLADIKNALQSAYNSYGASTSSNKNSGGGGGGGGLSLRPYIEITSQSNVIGNESSDGEIFTDLYNFDWAKNSIMKLYNKGIVSGNGQGGFTPEAEVTRAEFVKMAVLASDNFDNAAQCEFADVEIGDWSYPYIASACAKGIINGIGDGRFGSKLSITREDMAVIIYRMMKNSNVKMEIVDTEFSDSSDISDYAKEAVSALYSIGIVKGTDGGRFEPKGNTSRAQAAVIFDRYLELLGNVQN